MSALCQPSQPNQCNATSRRPIENQIQTIIIRSLHAHDEAKKQFAQSLKVQELIQKFIKTTATKTVAMQLQKEASANQKQLRSLLPMKSPEQPSAWLLIQKATNKWTAPIRNNLTPQCCKPNNWQTIHKWQKTSKEEPPKAPL